jgi:hypothetical protein
MGTRNVVHDMKQMGVKNYDNLVRYNCWRIKYVSLYDPQAYGTHTFFTTGFPRFLSIRGARGLQAIDLLWHT